MSEQQQQKVVAPSKKRKKDLRWEAMKLSSKLKKRKINDENENTKEATIKKLHEIRDQMHKQKLFHHEKKLKQVLKKAITFVLRSNIQKLKAFEKNSTNNNKDGEENKSENPTNSEVPKGLKKREKKKTKLEKRINIIKELTVDSLFEEAKKVLLSITNPEIQTSEVPEVKETPNSPEHEEKIKIINSKHVKQFFEKVKEEEAKNSKRTKTEKPKKEKKPKPEKDKPQEGGEDIEGDSFFVSLKGEDEENKDVQDMEDTKSIQKPKKPQKPKKNPQNKENVPKKKEKPKKFKENNNASDWKSKKKQKDKKKEEPEEKVHPSWEAKKMAHGKASQVQNFVGKRIVFGE